ncbi:Uncharacterised protein [Mycobacteroides abscessus subsp. abscessus]|uniref:Uncharacterized protein n=1 Tax=Mycobacteroides abscessus subsp. abscessus TaxID=1185650 RepID=A0AB74FKL7_9MYCO|nr:Uncharacterised protein [Mycobacteroides abscessus subsp. abscessus]SKP52353.1 Uncharacterised protein [Mycobacteroides abscessus subsp. massiliense]SHR28284.1 Uncharacterised protein [Mycobacteroides abscessus subsp. abscessus]SHT18113.1 Uncharacterised protein [Mycobacteroides abscessus subsp. abscessus]SHT85453.1 Uncharacterised protein [Mycobacteroides abscessus subsp. abscessus]
MILKPITQTRRLQRLTTEDHDIQPESRVLRTVRVRGEQRIERRRSLAQHADALVDQQRTQPIGCAHH